MSSQNKFPREDKEKKETETGQRKKPGFFKRRNRFNFNFSAEDVDHIHNQLFERNYH